MILPLASSQKKSFVQNRDGLTNFEGIEAYLPLKKMCTRPTEILAEPLDGMAMMATYTKIVFRVI